REAVRGAALADRTALTRLFGLSRDLMIRSAALMGSFAFFTAQTSRAGELQLAANAVVLNFLMVTAFFLDGQAQAAEQLCGKAVGANWRPAFDRAVRLAMVWGFVIAGGLFAIWIAAGPALIDLMTTSQEVRAVARDYLLLAALTALTGVLPFVMDGVMTGATLNTIIRNGMLASLAVFLAAALILQPLWGIYGLWAALHLFFVSRGFIYWIAVNGQMGKLFAAASELDPA
ncbi:MAG TPA: MATE family efflux transporter, partial [Devosiaceae bacterium]|nr:MATE family efflux transporter [Devosiaceae bacterium]